MLFHILRKLLGSKIQKPGVAYLTRRASFMKKKIHPEYYPETTITCACGNFFKVGSTVKDISVEICSKCHPFYTGKQKLIDTSGRVDRYKARAEKQATASSSRLGKKAKKAKSDERKVGKKTQPSSVKKSK